MNVRSCEVNKHVASRYCLSATKNGMHEENALHSLCRDSACWVCRFQSNLRLSTRLISINGKVA